MRSCGDCSAVQKEHGNPAGMVGFWIRSWSAPALSVGGAGKTEIVDDGVKPLQLDLFAGLDFGCLPDERDADGADRPMAVAVEPTQEQTIKIEQH